MGKLGKSLKYVMGFILSMSVSIMLIGGSFSLDCFYDQGRVCDAFGMELGIPGTNIEYLDSDNYWTIKYVYADKMIDFYLDKWNYLVLNVSHLNQEKLDTTFVFYQNEQEIDRKDVNLSLGENIVELDGEYFNRVLICMQEAQGVQIRISSAQVREQLMMFSFARFIAGTVLVFLLYLMICQWGKRGGEGSVKGYNYFLELFFKIQEKIYLCMQKSGSKLSVKQKSCIRTVLFVVINLLTTFTLNVDRVVKWHPMNSLFYSILFCFLAVCSTEERPVTRYCNKEIWGVFLLFCGWLCVSDFIVLKKFCYVGYIFGVFVGMFFYAWSKMEKPEKILKELVCAVQISFGLFSLFCLICRPLKLGVRYNGCFTNPNSYANYLIPVAVAWIACVEEYMKKHKAYRYEKWLLGGEGCIIGYFLWKTQSRGAMLACFIIGVWFLCRQWKRRVDVYQIKRVIQLLMVFLILCVPVMESMEWMLQNLPYKLNTVVVYSKENVALYRDEGSGGIFTTTVQAAQSRIGQKLKADSLDSFSSGRITYWKAYLREMNLWGHEYKAKVNGENHAAHNMVIEIAYRYGVVAAAVYLVMWGYFLVQAWRRLGEKRKFSFAASGWLLSYVVLAMLDALEQPWIYIAWVLAYTVMGYWMIDDGNEKDTEKMVESE
ncbi:MAG: hypothetical protein NC307_07045 [Roseburia sp.]|nr:hypothetical protein [Roseburia sp.]